MSLNFLRNVFPIDTTRVDIAAISSKDVEAAKDTRSISNLIVGEINNLNSSLLFQAAVSMITEGGEVFYIRQQPFTSLPTLVHGMVQPDHITMRKLRFMYMHTVDELMKFLSSVHMKVSVIPVAVVIENLHEYVDQFVLTRPDSDVEHIIARVCALLLDTVHYFSSKLGRPCQLVVSCADPQRTSVYSDVCSHFFTAVWLMIVSKDNTRRYDACLRLLHETESSLQATQVVFYQEKQQLFLKEIRGKPLSSDRVKLN